MKVCVRTLSVDVSNKSVGRPYQERILKLMTGIVNAKPATLTIFTVDLAARILRDCGENHHLGRLLLLGLTCLLLDRLFKGGASPSLVTV